MYEHRANFHLLVELLLHVTKIKYSMYNVQDYSVLCNKAVRPGYEWGLAFYSHVENTHERIISLIGDVYVLITSLTPSLLSYCHHWASVVCRPLTSHFNQLIWSHWVNLNQTLVEWSLDSPLPKWCPVIPNFNQDGHQAKNRKKGEWNFNCWLLL